MSAHGVGQVIAVVPAYRPDAGFPARLASLLDQVSAIIVVDDGSPAGSEAVFDAVTSPGIELVRTGTNRGIAAALNTGAGLALDRGADYVLTVDQDSLLADGYVSACLAAFGSSSEKLGIVCTDRVNGEASIPERYTAEGLGVVREAIQSGFLISAECIRECGLFDERLFIDCVDTEYCMRVAEHGFVIVVGSGTDIEHSLGEQAPLRPFGVQRHQDGHPLTYQYHSPWRRYFITRNNVDLFLRYLRRKPRWVLSAFRRELGPGFTTIVSGPHRARQLLAAIIGLAHGLVRRRGPLAPGLRRALTPR